MNKYYTDPNPDLLSEYGTLHRPDGTEVATLTEPADRTWTRDLASVVEELNTLYTERKDLAERLYESVKSAKDMVYQLEDTTRWLHKQIDRNDLLRYDYRELEKLFGEQREMGDALAAALRKAKRCYHNGPCPACLALATWDKTQHGGE